VPPAVCSVQITVASQEDGQRKAAVTTAPGQGPVQVEDPTWAVAELEPPEGEDEYSFFAPGMGLDDED
jgi:hypothetical protein